MKAKEIYALLKEGSPEERALFVESAPDNSSKTAALGLVGSENLGLVVLGMTSMAMEYCNGRDPSFGAALAEAVHLLAREVFQNSPDHGGLIPNTLSNLAGQHLNALSLLGRSEEVLRFSEKYIPFYKALDEKENLPSLRCSKANALINLNRLDEAENVLKTTDSSRNPGAKIEVNRLLNKIAQLKVGITNVRPPKPTEHDADLMQVLKTALGGFGNEGEQMRALLEKMGGVVESAQAGPAENERFQQYLDLLKKGEAFITKNTDDENEWTMKGRLREATKIFKLELRPAPQKIAASLQELSAVLDWAKLHHHFELANDTYWGMYLCYSRRVEDSKAADALISLRANLEKQREGIEDRFERGGAFSTYPYLFSALCEKLQRSGRYDELLESIEASKGRGIADILTSQSTTPIPDMDIYSAARRLPSLTRKHGFSYLSYYVDRYDGEARVYQVVVGKDGRVYGTDPVILNEKEMDSALENLDPKKWGSPSGASRAERIPDASGQLAPLGDFLLKLKLEGVLDEGSHICYTADENLNNMPLHYLPFQGKKLVDFFSLSKIHNSLHLEMILEGSPVIPKSATAFIVPAQHDVTSKNWSQRKSSLYSPAKHLKSILPTDIVENEKVSVKLMKKSKLSKKVLHFSTHGFFPEKTSDKTPFLYSGAVISDGNSLPDGEKVAKGDTSYLLTPDKVISNRLKMQDSHVTLMACISGLSREGLAGDALGLDWAFVQAGVRSMLASHWLVSAADAAGFCNLFYAKWLKEKKTRGYAFRETINELRANNADAHCWAAFSLSGDWR